MWWRWIKAVFASAFTFCGLFAIFWFFARGISFFALHGGYIDTNALEASLTIAAISLMFTVPLSFGGILIIISPILFFLRRSVAKRHRNVAALFMLFSLICGSRMAYVDLTHTNAGFFHYAAYAKLVGAIIISWVASYPFWHLWAKHLVPVDE